MFGQRYRPLAWRGAGVSVVLNPREINLFGSYDRGYSQDSVRTFTGRCARIKGELGGIRIYSQVDIRYYYLGYHYNCHLVRE